MKKHIVLISKDATLPEYFGPYGAKYIKTPNIDELAKKGTVFRKHYTAAPSTSMAFAAMFTGKFSYQMEYTHYIGVEEYKGRTLFDELYEKGYECHLMWSNNYIKMAEKYTKCYGRHTIHHDTMKFNQSCGFNTKKILKEDRKRDETLAQKALMQILAEIDTIPYNEKPVFLWIHMPHCIIGRIAYGDDIDIFDTLIGEIRKRFGDDNLFVTADHAHMNGTKGKLGYGFDVYDRAARIPLIAPRINDSEEINFVTSNTQLTEIILNHTVTPLECAFCDSAYFAQPNRKLAIIKDKYYYIFNKLSNTEELYDMELDPTQQINLLKPFGWDDKDRLCITDVRQVIQYPYWDVINSIAKDFREKRLEIWKRGPKMLEFKLKWKYYRVKFGYYRKGLLKKMG